MDIPIGNFFVASSRRSRKFFIRSSNARTASCACRLIGIGNPKIATTPSPSAACRKAPFLVRSSAVSSKNFDVALSEGGRLRIFRECKPPPRIRPVANLLPRSHTTTLTSYAFGSASNGVVPVVRQRNSFSERRSAKNCSHQMRADTSAKKPIQPSATAAAKTSPKMQGTGWKNIR